MIASSISRAGPDVHVLPEDRVADDGVGADQLPRPSTTFGPTLALGSNRDAASAWTGAVIARVALERIGAVAGEAGFERERHRAGEMSRCAAR